MEEQRRQKEASASVGGVGPRSPTSPQTVVEEQSLQQTMDKNKESLKRKLMLRRSVNELVDQGIYPPLKTPPAYAEQRKQLERAKTGDLLRHKIQQRPDRQSLVQQHILEESKVAPSLQDRQRQLKKARLQDSLSDRLANRPGPLELVQANILQTDPALKDNIIEGKIQFMKTHDGDNTKTQIRHFMFEDDSNPSDGAPSPVQLLLSSGGAEGEQAQIGGSTSNSSGSTGIPTPPDLQAAFLQNVQTVAGGPPKTFIFTSAVPPIPSSFTTSPTSVTSVSLANTSGLSRNGSPGSNSSNSSSSSKLARLKKSKPKTTPKAKVIKFHEYKGPPNVVKSQQSQSPSSSSNTVSNGASLSSGVTTSSNSSSPIGNKMAQSNSETPYHILLQQQQLFLQWQLEFHHNKSIPFILPTTKADGVPTLLPSSTSSSVSPPLPTVPPPPPTSFTMETSIIPPVVLTTSTTPTSTSTTTSTTTHTSTSSTSHTINRDKIKSLEDLKVADLKAECKKRNLLVSGPKPQLLERLKPFAENILASLGVVTSISTSNSPAALQTMISSGSDNSLTSPPSVQSLSGLINIQPVTPQSVAPSEESCSIHMGSPPESPSSSVADLNLSHSSLGGPLSPPDTIMDTMIASPPMFSLGAGSQVISKTLQQQVTQAVPMLVDQVSRPPSVAPMDIEMSGSQTNLAALAPSPIQVQPVDLNQNPGVIANSVNPPVVTIAPETAPTLQVGQPQAISQEELLRQQQQKIEELQRQLQQSQLRLKEAQDLKDAQLRQRLGQAPTPVQPPPPPPPPPLPLMTSTGGICLTTQATNASVGGPAVAAIQVQASASQPSLVATTTVVPNTSALTRDVVANLIQIRALQQGINKNNQKVVQVSTAAPPTQTIMLTTPQKQKQQQQQQNKDIKPKIVTLPINGISTSRASSVPSSPVGHGKLQRSATNPFFTNVPHVKEPPKYDEAIKNRQNLLVQQQNSPATDAAGRPMPAILPIKSQVMDDVLEILIRTGELPPSAAQEPPPTPKGQAQGQVQGQIQGQEPSTSMTVAMTTMNLPSSVAPSVSTVVIPASSAIQLPTIFPSETVLTTSQPTPVTTAVVYTPSSSPSPGTITLTGASPAHSCTPPPLSNGPSPHTVLSPPGALSPVNSLVFSPSGALSPSGGLQSIKSEIQPPLEPVTSTCQTLHDTSLTEGGDLTYSLSDQLANNIGDLPFITMDWSDSDTNMNGLTLDFPDMLDTPDPLGLGHGHQSPKPHSCIPVFHSSIHNEPTDMAMGNTSDSILDIAEASDLGNGDDGNVGLGMDVSDWLDVIMPSTGLTPISTNAPVAFPSDPILTPKPQDVLDLFNMEESDLCTPTEINMTFDKAMEMSSSKS